jgi:IclR family transcriptional regulator, KDG regulon repressor
VLDLDSAAGDRTGNTPQTVRRAIGLLDLLAATPRGQSLRQLSESGGLSRSTTHRLISALVSGGLVTVCPDTRRYRLGTKLLELSAALLDSMDVQEEARPFMQRLSEASRETVHLGVLDGFEVMFIGHIESPESLRMSGRVGRRTPAHSSSLGKVLLAWTDEAALRVLLRRTPLAAQTARTITDPEQLLRALEEVRARGYATDEEENRVGTRCVGAPVRDHTGRAIAAISVSGPSFRFTAERADEIVPHLQDTAAGISERMGWRGGRWQDRLLKGESPNGED